MRWAPSAPTTRAAGASGRLGQGALPRLPAGHHLQRAPHPRSGASTIVGPNTCLTAGMAPGPGDAERPGGPHRRSLPHRPGLPHRRPLEHRDRRRHPDRALRLHHRSEPHLRGSRRADRAAVAGRGSRRIGSGSWLGANVVVLPGAQIGEHVVVAAGAVVRGDIPDHCVVAGVPARIVRRWVDGQRGGWTRRTIVAAVDGGDAVALPGDGERAGRAWHRRAAVRHAHAARNVEVRGRGTGPRARTPAALLGGHAPVPTDVDALRDALAQGLAAAGVGGGDRSRWWKPRARSPRNATW